MIKRIEERVGKQICPRCMENTQEIEYGLCKDCYIVLLKREVEELKKLAEKKK
jgi:hypothetical protein